MSDWGQRIREARMHEAMSMSEFARRIDVAAPSVHAWESGKANTISAHNLFKVARLLNVSPSWLLYGDEGEVATGAPLSQPARPDRARLRAAVEVVEDVLAELQIDYPAKQRADLILGCYIALEAGNAARAAKSVVSSLLEAQANIKT